MSKLESIRRRAVVEEAHTAQAQAVMFLLGCGTAWIGIALALAWWQPAGLNFLLTPAGIGAALAATAIPVWVNFGFHEAMHHLAAEQYCGHKERNVFFVTTPGILIGNLMSVAMVGTLIALEVWLGIDVAAIVAGFVASLGINLGTEGARAMTLLFFSVSPGGVAMAVKGAAKECHDDTAVAGPMANLIIGVGFWAAAGFTLPPLSAALPFWDLTFALTIYVALLLSIMNALPIGSGSMATDGYKVLLYGEPMTWAIQAACILIPAGILFGVI